MKNALKVIAIALTLVLALGVFTACSGNSGNTATTGGNNSTDNSAKQEHGYFKVFVPEGYTLKHEDAFGDNNPKAFNINLDDSSFTYFMFNIYTEDNAKSSVEATKEMNEGANDVSIEIGGKTWTGVAYDSLGIACFTMYADFDGNFVIVTAAGNAYDSEIVASVLSSLEVNVTE